MASKKELIDRWKSDPWKKIDKEIYDYCINQATQSPPWNSAHPEKIFNLLKGIPFLDEVPGGRDLRGSSFPGAMNIDLSNTDFSYCSRLGGFTNCNLDNAQLNYVKGSIYEIRGTYRNTSFQNARLQKTYLDRSGFINCSFNDSNLKSANFRGSDLRGTSFVNANCEYADFQECDLRGCNFQNANLRGVMFRAVKLDKTTDLRGAVLYDIMDQEHRNFNGGLVLKGTDWRKATYDDSTQYGKDPAAFEKDLLNHIYKLALKEKKEWADFLAKEIKECIKQLKKGPGFKWYDELLSRTAHCNQQEIKDFLERSSMDFT